MFCVAEYRFRASFYILNDLGEKFASRTKEVWTVLQRSLGELAWMALRGEQSLPAGSKITLQVAKMGSEKEENAEIVGSFVNSVYLWKIF